MPPALAADCDACTAVFDSNTPDFFRSDERPHFEEFLERPMLNYEFTAEDPEAWTKPWTAIISWSKIAPDEQMHEYACHEDNYDMVHFLAGAREREKNGGTK
jgi:hypothetical protein